jgi:hypothetical protein
MKASYTVLLDPTVASLRIRDAIRNAQPFSLIRIGDGETSLLDYANEPSHRIQHVLVRALGRRKYAALCSNSTKTDARVIAYDDAWPNPTSSPRSAASRRR